MKKLLLFALPVCLLTSYVARAEETVQPAEQTEARVEVDPAIVAEFNEIMGEISADCRSEFNIIRDKYIKGFDNHPGALRRLAKAVPNNVVENGGHEYLVIPLGNLALELPAAEQAVA